MTAARRIRLLLSLPLLLALANADAGAICTEFGGFAIFQCSDLAYFDAVPDPNFVLIVDPNNRVTNIQALFWQIGFGNQKINSGLGSAGTGNSGVGLARVDGTGG